MIARFLATAYVRRRRSVAACCAVLDLVVWWLEQQRRAGRAARRRLGAAERRWPKLERERDLVCSVSRRLFSAGLRSRAYAGGGAFHSAGDDRELVGAGGGAQTRITAHSVLSFCRQSVSKRDAIRDTSTGQARQLASPASRGKIRVRKGRPRRNHRDLRTLPREQHAHTRAQLRVFDAVGHIPRALQNLGEQLQPAHLASSSKANPPPGPPAHLTKDALVDTRSRHLRGGALPGYYIPARLKSTAGPTDID